MDLRVDMSQVKAFGRRLEVEAPQLTAGFQAGLMEAAEITAAKARRNAASFPRKGPGTTRIADSVRVRRRGFRVRVQAGAAGAPEAAPIEHHGRSGSFRHPLFGDREHWYSQPAHPFLTPAAEESLPEVEAAVLGLIDVTLARMVT